MGKNAEFNRVLIGMMFISGVAIGPAAVAQLVPPAPPKLPSTPEYTPPPPVAPPVPIRAPDGKAAPQPTEPEKALASLIERDEKGKIKPLAFPVDEAAVRALELNDDAKAKIATSLAARRDDLDLQVIDKLEDLLAVRKAIGEANEQTGVEVITETAKKTAAFRNNSLIDRLQRDGAITMMQKTQATKIAREYKSAVREESIKDAGGSSNFQAMMLIGFRLTVDDLCGEAFKELDRMIIAAAPDAENLVKGMNLPASHPANRKVADAKRPAPAGKTQAEHQQGVLRGMFFDDFDLAQKQAFLRAANPGLVAKPKSTDKPAETAKEPTKEAPKDAPKK